MTARGSRWTGWALIAAVFVAVNCVCDPYWSIGGEVSCVGVDPARIRDVLTHDAQIRITRSGKHGDGTFDWCERGGIVANVEISPDVVRVTVGSGAPPSRIEAPLWKERADYVCGRLSAACPGLGAWKSWDYSDPSRSFCTVAQLVFLGVGAAGAWVVIRSQRRKVKAAATPGGTN